jgi:NAD kinase
VAPHLALDRSVVLAGDQVVTVEVGSNRPAVLVIDGREVGRLSPGADITCRAASRPLRLVSVDQRGLAGLLRSALALDQGP